MSVESEYSHDIASLKNVYDACVHCELKTEQSTAHISYKCMASLQCEYGCDAANYYYSWQSKDSVGTDVT